MWEKKDSRRIIKDIQWKKVTGNSKKKRTTSAAQNKKFENEHLEKQEACGKEDVAVNLLFFSEKKE